jgi:PKD repeat protein
LVADATVGPAPLTVNFTDTSTNSPTEWYWVFGDGSTSTAQNATHIYLSAGTYTVTLTAYNDEGSNKTTRSDYITATESVTPPTASFSSDVTTGSSPLTVQFTDTSGNSPTAWVWTFGDGDSSTLPNPSHTYSADGTYTVKLTASNSGGTNTVVRSGYITVAVVTTSETVIPSTTIPESTVTDTLAASQETTASGSASGESGGILPYAGVAVLVVIGIVAWIFLKRPPRGPHHSGGREL